jgi:hypothetical protein
MWADSLYFLYVLLGSICKTFASLQHILWPSSYACWANFDFSINRAVFLDEDRTMVNVQKHNICTNTPSSQTFRSCLLDKIVVTTILYHSIVFLMITD